MKRKIIKRTLAALILIAAAVAGGYAYRAAGVTTVDAVAAGRATVQEVIEDTGTVTARRVSVVVAKNSFDITSILCQIGDPVAAGALVMTTDVKDNGADALSLQAQAVGLEAQLAQARENAENLKNLYENGAVSKIEYDTAATAEREIAAQLQSLRYSVQSVRNNAQSNRVEAPIGGMVTELFVSEGDTAIMGARLLEISDMDSLYIKANLLADDAAKVQAGDVVILETRSETACSVEKIAPKVTESMSDLGIAQKRVEVEIAAEDREGLVLGGDMDIKIVVNERENVVSVPRKAVFSQNQKDCVYVVDADAGRVALREIAVGLKGGDVYEILEGVAEGEWVVLSPDGALADGARVKLSPAQISP
jgi:HlyD family secretion protein